MSTTEAAMMRAIMWILVTLKELESSNEPVHPLVAMALLDACHIFSEEYDIIEFVTDWNKIKDTNMQGQLNLLRWEYGTTK